MEKYNLYESLDLLDYIKRSYDIDKIRNFKFSKDLGYGATFNKRLMYTDKYMVTKGIIKNKMLCYKEKSVHLGTDNEKGGFVILKKPDYKLVYGNVSDLNEINLNNINDFDNIYDLLKAHLISNEYEFDNEEISKIKLEIMQIVKGDFNISKVNKPDYKVLNLR